MLTVHYDKYEFCTDNKITRLKLEHIYKIKVQQAYLYTLMPFKKNVQELL